jgi:tetratricopeptide (TPR) repeat protein
MADLIGNLVSITWWRKVFAKTGPAFGIGCASVMALSMVGFLGWNSFSGRNQQPTSEEIQNHVIMTANGEPITQGDFNRLSQQAPSSHAGAEFARMQGMILDKLVSNAIILQEAKKRSLHANEADIDRAMQQERETKLGQHATDSEWESYVERAHNMSLAEYRDAIAKVLVGPALFNSYKNNEKVTQEEARNQSAEVRTSIVIVPALAVSPMFPLPKTGPKPLPDAVAKKKAEALLAQARGGKDIAVIAKANSSDPSAKRGGDLDWRLEYKGSQGMPPLFGILGYGKDFDDAVHKTTAGQLTDIVKVTGFQQGYAFARVVNRRNNLPKDFAPEKVVDSLKQERAMEKLTSLLKSEARSAKVVFPATATDKKAYYDYNKLQQMQQAQTMAMFGNADSEGPPPSKADIDKQQALVDSEFEAILKSHPDDTTAALMVADSLEKRRQFAPGTSPAQQAQNRDRLISLYEIALKTMEDRDIRFKLADLYKEKQQYKQAYAQYNMINRLMNSDTPYDAATTQQALLTRKRLLTSFKSLNSPDAPDAANAAAKQQAEIARLTVELPLLQQKEADERKKAQQSSTLQGGIPSPSVGVPATGNSRPATGANSTKGGPTAPAKTGTVTVPAPARDSKSAPGATKPPRP